MGMCEYHDLPTMSGTSIDEHWKPATLYTLTSPLHKTWTPNTCSWNTMCPSPKPWSLNRKSWALHPKPPHPKPQTGPRRAQSENLARAGAGARNERGPRMERMNPYHQAGSKDNSPNADSGLRFRRQISPLNKKNCGLPGPAVFPWPGLPNRQLFPNHICSFPTANLNELLPRSHTPLVFPDLEFCQVVSESFAAKPLADPFWIFSPPLQTIPPQGPKYPYGVYLPKP